MAQGSFVKDLPPEAYYVIGGVVVVFGVLWYIQHELGKAADAVAGAAGAAYNAAENGLQERSADYIDSQLAQGKVPSASFGGWIKSLVQGG